MHATAHARPSRPTQPSTEAIAALPPFAPLALERISVPRTGDEFAQALATLRREAFIGFDTESKPTFRKGETSTGPHVVQFATLERAWLFQVGNAAGRTALGELLASATTVKVGFGLRSDRSHIRARLGSPLRGVLDLTTWFHGQGYRNEIGVRGAIAIVLGQQFRKSKRLSTSNWAAGELSPAQCSYAANDAFGAIAVFHALAARGENRWPILNGDDIDATTTP